jgi:hypothetical protein
MAALKPARQVCPSVALEVVPDADAELLFVLREELELVALAVVVLEAQAKRLIE